MLASCAAVSCCSFLPVRLFVTHWSKNRGKEARVEAMVVLRRVVLMALAAQVLPGVWMGTLFYEQGISPKQLLLLVYSSHDRGKCIMDILGAGSSLFAFVSV